MVGPPTGRAGVGSLRRGLPPPGADFCGFLIVLGLLASNLPSSVLALGFEGLHRPPQAGPSHLQNAGPFGPNGCRCRQQKTFSVYP